MYSPAPFLYIALRDCAVTLLSLTELMDYSANVPITKEYILKRVTQEKIFEYYLNVEVQTERQFCNPLRKDDNPTCNFSYHGEKLRFRDWSWPRPLDCFDIVMKMYGLDFDDALKRIASDFNLTDASENSHAVMRFRQIREAEGTKKRARIRVRISSFKEQDKRYLQSHGVHGEQCKKFNVKPIDRVWVRGNLIWGYHEKDPALGYYFGKDDEGHELWKIYYYGRSSGTRFICNCNKIQGWEQLPARAPGVVITKSLKDVMALDNFGIPAIAPQGESQNFPEDKMEKLQERFDIIRSLYDFDSTGVSAAQRLRKSYGVPPLFLTDGRFGTQNYAAKDFSDFVKYNGEQQARGIIHRQLDKMSLNKETNETLKKELIS